MLGVLIFPDPGQFRRPNSEASIITDDLKPGERFGSLFLYLLQDWLVAEEV
jgi:hypothetical protein